MADKPENQTKKAPFETDDLRKNLVAFLDKVHDGKPIGNNRWGVYAFFDYDDEPIYVGQTNEMVRTRIRRHLTNQRTDAVAMSVLDPFEVYTIKVWPLPQYEDVGKGHAKFKDAKKHLNALERAVHDKAIAESKFKAILNEKDPELTDLKIDLPAPCEGRIVSDAVKDIRGHPDFRMSRRALIISRLAQVISEREVKVGLRRVLLTQARRLEWLAQQRFDAYGGAAAVPVKSADDEEADGAE
jgi:hypothetical protein